MKNEHLIQQFNGIWPTMITPFTDTGILDTDALAHLIAWYLERQVNGLFTVCQSSEMFYLSLEERVTLAATVVKLVEGQVPVIASGHISDTLTAQVEEVQRVADTGVDAVVLVTNRFAQPTDPDTVWQQNLERFLARVPDDIALGFYECPYPYKRLLTPELLAWCAATGRFLFLKDTSCDLAQMRAKQAAVQNSYLKIFNANAATLLDSLRAGLAGYSGVMANFHPQVYAWLWHNWTTLPDKAQEVQDFLGAASLIERQVYPVNAKYFLQLEGIPISLHTRCRDANTLTDSCKFEVAQFRAITRRYMHGSQFINLKL
ncbi:MAG: dihydrodipicolinate synthase family protein [Anaerolineae bacterium]|nr:dihydrodipicolinate synthase family protein [Anaerolineae bacterium]